MSFFLPRFYRYSTDILCYSVVEVGNNVKELAIGDRVCVECVFYCGKCFYCIKQQTHLCLHYDEMGFTLPGGYTSFVEVEKSKVHKFSENLSFELAALTEPAAVAGIILKLLFCLICYFYYLLNNLRSCYFSS